MKTPTLEEVKAYFKNAKEVRCLEDNQIFDISKWEVYFDNLDGSYWVENTSKKNGQVELFDKGKYAEIISYKEIFEYLEEVEVSDDGVNWECGNYCCILPDNSYVVWLEYRKEALGFNNIRKLNIERTQAIETIKQLMLNHKIYMYEINQL